VAYLTAANFKTRSLLPPEYVDAVEAVQAGFTDAQLESCSKLDIDARLTKRYAVPFETPVPEAVLSWLTRIVTHRVCLRRGVDPTDQQAADIKADHDEAKAEIKEAADSNESLFELPLRADTTASGISKGAPRSYSEQSPYVWMDGQACTGREEDRAGRGT
jgi:phage gp36-like protein